MEPACWGGFIVLGEGFVGEGFGGKGKASLGEGLVISTASSEGFSELCLVGESEVAEV